MENRFRSFAKDDLLPLFPGRNTNENLSPRQTSNLFLKWRKKSNIRQNLTIHSFRSGYATTLYQKTKDPLLVSYALGYSSFNTTKRYIDKNILNMSSLIDNVFPEYLF